MQAPEGMTAALLTNTSTASENGVHFGNSRPDLRLVTHVGACRHGVAAFGDDGVDDFLTTLSTEVDQADTRSFSGIALGNTGADAAAGPCYNGNFSL
jgi:hypothetical protein